MAAADHLGVQFSFAMAEPRSMDGPRMHSVQAHLGEEQVGSVEWSPKTGEVHNIKVNPEHRRVGIATALWGQAKEAGTARGVRPPRHSPERTTAGDAWARTLGERLPAVVGRGAMPLATPTRQRGQWAAAARRA